MSKKLSTKNRAVLSKVIKKSVTFAQNYHGNVIELFPNNCLTKNLRIMSDVQKKVVEIIVDKLGVKESEVVPEASFTNHLGADSLDTVELIMEFEKAFDIQIPDEDAEKIATVGDAISYIEAHKK